MADILIIGAGVAGLSAGIYARLSGHNVVVCEAHSIPGGNLTGWQRGEYHIDNCIHWLTGTNPSNKMFYDMWCELGVLGDGIRVHQGDVLFKYELNGETLSVYRDLYRMRDEMLSLSPEDRDEILSLIRAVELVERLNNVGGENKNEGISLGQLIKGVPTLIKYYNLSCKELSERFKHPIIRRLIASIIGRDFGSLALLMIIATFSSDNGGIPEGGSYAMAQRMAKRLTDLGGRLLTNKRAVKINTVGKRASSVSFADGDTLSADYVIAAIDPAILFGELTDIPMTKALLKNYKNDKLFRFSSYHCAFACDTDEPPFEGDVLFPVPIKYYSRLKTDHITLREFTHEPTYAPEGKTVLGTMTYCDEELSEEFISLRAADSEAYKAKKEELACIIERCILLHYPSLEGKIRLIDTWTPASYKRFTHSDMGAFMSFAMPKKVLPTRISHTIPGCKNLLIATQWQQLPGGLPTAAALGKSAIKSINKMCKN